MSQTSNQTAMSPSDYETESKRFNFVVKSLLARVRTAGPVEVVAVTNSGGVSPIGYVDIKPLVQQVTGDGSAVDHGVIYNVPYLRVQGGGNAVIIDPHVGDIGLAAFCDRDISKVKATGSQAAPGSLRRHNMADAVYLYSIMAAAPTQYIQFVGGTVNVVSPGLVHIQAPSATIDATTTTVNGNFIVNGNTTMNGNISQTAGSGAGTATLIGPLTVTNDVTANGTSLHTHKHSGVTTGGGNTGAPV